MFDFGMLGGLLSAGGGILDSIMGNDQEKKALKLAKKQFKLQKKLALGGFDDGRGLKVYWNPDAGPTGEGEWTIDYSGVAQQQEDTSNQLELDRMQEEPRLAQERYENAMQRSSMRPIIDTLINKLKTQSEITPEALQGDLNYLSGSALDDVYGKVQGDIARTALRSPGSFNKPTSAGNRLVSSLAKDKKDAMVENRLKALTGADEINSSRRGNLINQLNSLSANAFNYDDVPFSPSQLDTKGTAIAQNSANRAPYGLSAGLQGVLQAQPQSQPYGEIATGIGGILSSIGNIFNKQNSQGAGPNTTLGNKTTAQHNEYLRNYNYDRAF